MADHKYVFSLGYRCSAAGILKRIQAKTESYPFDWLVSRLPIVEHCIETDFGEFLNPDNYVYLHTNTHHYDTPESDPEWICGEWIHWNRFYETDLTWNREMYIPSPLSTPRDAYGHALLINHRNPTKPEDRAYYERCVDRWKQMMESDAPKHSLYIHPAQMAFGEEMVSEIERFHVSFSKHTKNHRGMYVIPIRNREKRGIETIRDTDTCKIAILWATRGLMDAGEIFMGDMWFETNVLCDYVREWLSL
jgi:hypothetical protein